MQEPDVVWMTLSHIDNDDTFLNSDFKPSSVTKSNTLSPTEQKKQIDQDYLIALSIEEEEKKQAANAAQAVEPFNEFNNEMDTFRDEELARQLQEEEDLREVQEYERNRAAELQNRKLNMQPKKEFDSRAPLIYNNERFPQQQQFQYPNQIPAASHPSPSNRHALNRTDSSDPRSNAEYSRNKQQGNLHPNLNSTAPSENHTQSSSSSRGVHRNHHSSNHGHHKKGSNVSSLQILLIMIISLLWFAFRMTVTRSLLTVRHFLKD